MFQTDKETQLSRNDFSKKGSIDKKIISLIDKINSKSEYYTTSSCSGRIMLMSEGKTKKDANWIFVSHDKITFSPLKNALKKIPKQTVWFKFEPMILHVCCDSPESAEKILESAKSSGFKHSGIMNLKGRIIVEIRGTDFISAPIAFNGKISFKEDYLKTLVKEANIKMKRNDEKINKFSKNII
jgi:tRNA wybutosine-synthesizing protein 3